MEEPYIHAKQAWITHGVNRMDSGKGGCSVAKQETKLEFTFENPNTAAELEQALCAILVERLVSRQSVSGQ